MTFASAQELGSMSYSVVVSHAPPFGGKMILRPMVSLERCRLQAVQARKQAVHVQVQSQSQ